MEEEVFPYVGLVRQHFSFTKSLFLRYCCTYIGDEMENVVPPLLNDGEKIHYPIFHNECCVHANDMCSYVWAREGEQPLRNKSRG